MIFCFFNFILCLKKVIKKERELIFCINKREKKMNVKWRERERE